MINGVNNPISLPIQNFDELQVIIKVAERCN